MSELVDIQGATAKFISPGKKIVRVIGNEMIRTTFDAGTLGQIGSVADAPGVDEAVLNPDGHLGYGCPVGSAFSSREMIYPNAVGPDVKCSMSFLQFDLPADVLADQKLRRQLINAIEDRIPTGPGNHKPKKARRLDIDDLKDVAIHGATNAVCETLGIPREWNRRCEDASHGDPEDLAPRLDQLLKQVPYLPNKLHQLGGVGGGNHFMECNVVAVNKDRQKEADVFGLKDGQIGFLNHFGSRGFGYLLTSGGPKFDGHFKALEKQFRKWHTPFPGGDPHNVYMPLGSEACDTYLADINLASNFATVNHLLVSTYVVEAFREVLGESVQANLVYYIAHNIIRRELVDDRWAYVHRKGATRAFAAGHPDLKKTPYADTGHPILLPGNPVDGSTVMVGLKGSRLALNSVNHGAGRMMSRRQATARFDQKVVNDLFTQADILTNCRQYPVDEAPMAYKPYDQVIASVEEAGLAATVAKLRPIMNIKDNDTRQEVSA